MKAIATLLCLGIVISNFFAMSRWSEDRNVYDDACYLRQAHLFQRFGLDGLNTALARDDDGYMVGKLRKFPNWDQLSKSADTPCHTLIPASNKQVLQYPPGTGLVLALFPAGHQVVPLYGACTILVFGFAVLGHLAGAVAKGVGDRCDIRMRGALHDGQSDQGQLFDGADDGGLRRGGLAHREAVFRTGSASAAADDGDRSADRPVRQFPPAEPVFVGGLLPVLLVAFLMQRSRQSFVQGLGFGVALLIGMVPTLVANAINAGSPFSTTYGGPDTVAPALDFVVLRSYLVDLQFPLLLIAIGWTALAWRRGQSEIAFIVSANLAVNIVFFLTHPLFTPYYTVPVAALSLWTLLYGTLMASGGAVSAAMISPDRSTARR